LCARAGTFEQESEEMRLIRGFDERVAASANAARRHLITLIAVTAVLAISTGCFTFNTAAVAATDRASYRVVKRGDSLWTIAAAQLGQGASDRRIATVVTRLASMNAARLQRGRDYLLPGQRLRLPTGQAAASALRGPEYRPVFVRLGSGYHRAAGSHRVRDVQRMLACTGHPAGPADGRFGPRTLAAVDRFQRDHRLTVDGIVGRRTLASLRRACRSAHSVRHHRQRRPARAERSAVSAPDKPHRLPAAPVSASRDTQTPADHVWLWYACCAAAFAVAALVTWRMRARQPVQNDANTAPAADARAEQKVSGDLFTGAWRPTDDVPEIPLAQRSGPRPPRTSASTGVQQQALAVQPYHLPATPTVSVVILAFEQTANLLATLAGLPKGLAQVIVVDCTSLGRNLLAASRPPWRAEVIRHRACGRGEAFTVGLEHSRGEIVAVIDGSGLADPAAIGRLIQEVQAGATFAKGSRYLPGGIAGGDVVERVVDRALSRLVNTLFGSDYTDVRLGFSAFRRDSLPDLHLESADAEAAVLMNIQMAKAGLPVAEIATFAAPPSAGAAHGVRHVWRVVRAIIGERSSHESVATNGKSAAPPERADVPGEGSNGEAPIRPSRRFGRDKVEVTGKDEP
jgi:peptidoglycan hydrolase-like protein with peptidoglycan-binding domain